MASARQLTPVAAQELRRTSRPAEIDFWHRDNYRLNEPFEQVLKDQYSIVGVNIFSSVRGISSCAGRIKFPITPILGKIRQPVQELRCKVRVKGRWGNSNHFTFDEVVRSVRTGLPLPMRSLDFQVIMHAFWHRPELGWEMGAMEIHASQSDWAEHISWFYAIANTVDEQGEYRQSVLKVSRLLFS